MSADDRSTTPNEPRRYWRHVERQKEQILNVRAEAVRHRTRPERVIAGTARALAHPGFFFGELAFHLAWTALNSTLPEHLRWDPYPFGLLTGFASVQALFIGLLILMYHDRSALIGEAREETELQVNLHTERETTKLLRMMAEVQHTLGVESQEHDDELQEMAQPLNPARLHQKTEEELREVQEQ